MIGIYSRSRIEPLKRLQRLNLIVHKSVPVIAYEYTYIFMARKFVGGVWVQTKLKLLNWYALYDLVCYYWYIKII